MATAWAALQHCSPTMARDFCVHVPSDMLLAHADMSLRLSEAFIVWEPLPLHGANPLIRRTFKHTYLLFALEPGQLLYGSEYRYMRVERQQQPIEAGSPPSPYQEQALLNIRFCKTLLGAEAMDIPDLHVPLTSHDLEVHGVRQCEKYVRFTAEQITFGQLLQVIMAVHNGQPNYSLTTTNCIWFVDEVVNRLMGLAGTYELRRALAALQNEFRSHPRCAAARQFGPVLKEASNRLKQQGGMVALLTNSAASG